MSSRRIPNVRGRVPPTPGRQARGSGGRPEARFSSYNPVARVVTLRIDALDCPEFWLEVPVSLKAVEAFVHAATESIDASDSDSPD